MLLPRFAPYLTHFIDHPLPACTDPYLLALLSDGPLRSAPDTDSPDGIDYNSFQSLEWIGDSLLLHYLRTHWWQFYGPSPHQFAIPPTGFQFALICLSLANLPLRVYLFVHPF